ncbi:MAG: sugar nucleotide-binding protein, partial [Candidatus Woesearchaeota archaeon]
MKVLLTGASGFLGTKIYSELISKGFEVVPLYHEQIDITNYNLLKKFFKRKNPELVIHAAALTNVDYCEENKEECFRVNVIGTEFLQEICYKQKIKLVFLSTDFVFDGLRGNYREESIRNPINYYGFSKMIAEDIVKKSDKNLIIRASTIFGYFHNKKIDFPSFIIK